MLTAMLPDVPGQKTHGGTGSLTLYVFATDVEGNVTLLGRSQTDHTPTSITMANDAIAKPFGAIDTPGQGQTVSGILNNFGWALTPDSNTVADGTDILIPANGSTVTVFIDGQPVTRVTYNQCRGNVGNPPGPSTFCNDDVANIFGNMLPQDPLTARTANPTRFRNLDAGRGAIGSFQIDTTSLSNGIHTIAWSVTDSAGRNEGIGSRFFYVLNSSSGAAADAQTIQAGTPVIHGRFAAVEPVSGSEIAGVRRGFDLAARFEDLRAEGGRFRLEMKALERIEVRVPGADAAYLLVNGELRDLPAGASLAHGRLAWIPPAGYVGAYDLVLIRGGERIVLQVTVRPSH